VGCRHRLAAHRRGLAAVIHAVPVARAAWFGHQIMNCAKDCPKGLNPAKAIAEIRKMMVERQ